MKIGVFGTGMVGESIASKLADTGHEVMMGSRTKDNEKATAWAKKKKASQGTFSEAAQFGELLFNCTLGSGSLEALRLAGAENLGEKILVDVANALDFSRGMPPSLFVSNTDSLGERIQRTYPKLKVVKALNTMNCNIMVNPALVPGDHNVFMAGNEKFAKSKVASLLTEDFGWNKKNIIDLGDITMARGSESLLPLWVRLWGALQNPNFNFHVVIGPPPKA